MYKLPRYNIIWMLLFLFSVLQHYSTIYLDYIIYADYIEKKNYIRKNNTTYFNLCTLKSRTLSLKICFDVLLKE